MKRPRVGIVGTGVISEVYLRNLTTMFKEQVEVLGCADLRLARAEDAAREFDLPRRYSSPEALLGDPDVDMVLNLTIPLAHYEVSRAAVDTGKHVYVEKPLCAELQEAENLVAAANERGVLIGGAPDTFLGAAHQTARKAIDDGLIGKPVSAVAFMLCHGHESWHPDPAFYYKKAGGPMFDMGPYYLTNLVNLMGPVRAVSGSARITFPQRTITSEPRHGTIIDVEVPTHVAGTLDFASGAIGTIITSFDVWAHHLPAIEVYGTTGSLRVPDPNQFGGEVCIRTSADTDWNPVPNSHTCAENSRGLGVADMADAISTGRDPRASSDLTHHVLEIMHGIHAAAETGQRYEMRTVGVQPSPLPVE